MTWASLALLGGSLTVLWLLSMLWELRRTVIHARFTAERELASWRLRRTLLGLALLLPLMAVIIREVVQSH